jgi:hypothetical protein
MITSEEVLETPKKNKNEEEEKENDTEEKENNEEKGENEEHLVTVDEQIKDENTVEQPSTSGKKKKLRKKRTKKH